MVQTPLQSGLVIALSVMITLGILLLVRRRWPPRTLKPTNDITGFFSGVIGAIYAVILAFMLGNVAAGFDDARANTEQEANALMSLFRLADGLPPPDQTEVKSFARRYSQIMVDREWAAMTREEFSPESEAAVDRVWQRIMRVKPQSPAEQITLNHVLSALTRLMEHRRLRLLQSRANIPGILWSVLLVGGVFTVGFSFLFGVENVRSHALTTLVITVLISLTLVAIADVDRPFHGFVHVPPDGFEFAAQTFDRLSGTSPRPAQASVGTHPEPTAFLPMSVHPAADARGLLPRPAATTILLPGSVPPATTASPGRASAAAVRWDIRSLLSSDIPRC
jgi:hypothetical protein